MIDIHPTSARRRAMPDLSGTICCENSHKHRRVALATVSTVKGGFQAVETLRWSINQKHYKSRRKAVDRGGSISSAVAFYVGGLYLSVTIQWVYRLMMMMKPTSVLVTFTLYEDMWHMQETFHHTSSNNPKRYPKKIRDRKKKKRNEDFKKKTNKSKTRRSRRGNWS